MNKPISNFKISVINPIGNNYISNLFPKYLTDLRIIFILLIINIYLFSFNENNDENTKNLLASNISVESAPSYRAAAPTATTVEVSKMGAVTMGQFLELGENDVVVYSVAEESKVAPHSIHKDHGFIEFVVEMLPRNSILEKLLEETS